MIAVKLPWEDRGTVCVLLIRVVVVGALVVSWLAAVSTIRPDPLDASCDRSADKHDIMFGKG